MTSGTNAILAMNIMLLVFQIVCAAFCAKTKDRLFAALFILFNTIALLLCTVGIVVCVVTTMIGQCAFLVFLCSVNMIVGTIFCGWRHQNCGSKGCQIYYCCVLVGVLVVICATLIFKMSNILDRSLQDVPDTSTTGVEAIYETEDWHGVLK